MDVKYPDVTVPVTGRSFGNVIANVENALRREVSSDVAADFVVTAMDCGSYDELLQLAMATVNVK